VKLAIVATHPIQYYAPWFRHLAVSMDIEVMYATRQDRDGQATAGFSVPFDWDTPLLDGYAFRWLDNVARVPGVETFGGCDTPELFDLLRRPRFEACLILGWNRKCFLQAAAACWRAGIPLLVRGDSQLHTRRPRLLRWLKTVPYRLLLRRCAAHLYVGSRNREYLRHYGVPESKLFFAPHSVDSAFFSGAAARARTTRATLRLRETLGIGERDFVALFAGKLIPVKRPSDFIRAIAAVETLPSGRRLHGVVVGDGPMRGDLEAEAARSPRMHFAGFRNQSEIAAWYAAADVVVLPSQAETWGLVVNEAMACGLPAVVTETVGCAPDLIDEGRTGYVYPAGDVGALSARLGDVDRLLQNMAGEVRRSLDEKMSLYSFDSATRGVEAAVQAIAGSRRPAAVVV
jgi:glycosyltransferase involved in cell wall biosynthesis